MKILVKFPTRSRPKKFLETFEKYIKLSNNQKKTHYLITYDNDDKDMNNDQMKQMIDSYTNNVTYLGGHSRSKIHAVNRDMELVPPTWDILLLASDDMVPIVQGWDDIIRDNMAQYYPDTDGVLWFYDGRRKDLNTLVVEGRKYFERFNYIYNPEYISIYCDDEFTQVGNLLGKQTFIEETIIKHDHPSFIGEDFDDLMIRNENPVLYSHDHQILLKNKQKNFGINKGDDKI